MLHNFTINPYLLQVSPSNFLENKEAQGFPDPILYPTPKGSSRYPIRVIVIGIPDGVTSVIHDLYVKQFAQVYEWSPAVTAGQQGEVMKTMTRYFVINS